jgi:hypothetical protein
MTRPLPPLEQLSFERDVWKSLREDALHAADELAWCLNHPGLADEADIEIALGYWKALRP